MFGLSFGEVLLLGVMALVVIGPKQLPEVARNIGRFLNEMKRATETLTEDLKQQARIDFDLNARPKPPVVPDAEAATPAGPPSPTEPQQLSLEEQPPASAEPGIPPKDGASS